MTAAQNLQNHFWNKSLSGHLSARIQGKQFFHQQYFAFLEPCPKQALVIRLR